MAIRTPNLKAKIDLVSTIQNLKTEIIEKHVDTVVEKTTKAMQTEIEKLLVRILKRLQINNQNLTKLKLLKQLITTLPLEVFGYKGSLKTQSSQGRRT